MGITRLFSTINTKNNEQTLSQYQERAEVIAQSFNNTLFTPSKFFTNNHFQTLMGVLLRDRLEYCYWVPLRERKNFIAGIFHDNKSDVNKGKEWYDERELIETPDDDFFYIDYKYVANKGTDNDQSKGTVFVLHGLEGNSVSKQVIDIAKSCHLRGFDVVSVNFRGCTEEINNKPGQYHLGFTDDLKLLLKLFVSRSQTHKTTNNLKPFYLSGVSLGSNVIIKMLGEIGIAAQEEYNIYGAAVASVPFDLVKSAYILDRPGINKYVYTQSFLYGMKTKARKKYEKTYLKSLEGTSTSISPPFPFDYEGFMAATTISQIEDAYLAPIYGFKNHLDYYEKVSCGQFVPQMAVPVLAVNAKDDPFFHPFMSTTNNSCDSSLYNGNNTSAPNPLRLYQPDHGGHCGFMFHQDETITNINVIPTTSWLGNELSRFIDHVDTQL